MPGEFHVHVAGVKKVFAHVHQDNIPALQLYEKIGFQVQLIYHITTNYHTK